jgi:predicted ATPase
MIPPRSPTNTPLVGRSAELSALRALIDRSAKGRGEVALIEGESGIGKSRILAEALAHAKEGAAPVFLGRAEELERTRPFAAIAEALGCRPACPDQARAAIAAELAHAGADPPAPDPGLRYRVLEALVEVVESAAARGPVVLALEDLHWADPSTLLVLQTVARRLAMFPVAVVGTFRPSPRVPELERILDTATRDEALHVMLSALDQEAISELVRASLGVEPGPTLIERMAAAGGNPLFVIELLAALEQGKGLTLVDGKAEVDDWPFPPSLRLRSFVASATFPTRRSSYCASPPCSEPPSRSRTWLRSPLGRR